MTDIVTLSKSLGYSSIFLDFLAGRESATRFYLGNDLNQIATQLDKSIYERDRIVDILKRQNRDFGADSLAQANIELLKDERTVCVFTGQQAVLFGGPLLVLIKALAIVKAAKEYSQKLNRPVIPVFWIAGDDHDFEEANHTYLLDRKSEVVKIAYEGPASELATAETVLSDADALAQAKELFQETLGHTDFTDDLYKLIDEAYTPADTFVSAFGKLMARFTRSTGLILFNPCDPDVKQMAVPLFAHIVERQVELHERLTTANNELEQGGYHLQVEKKENAVHLFLNLNGRKPLMQQDDRFICDDREFTQQELLTHIKDNPGTVSPDVMLRPVLQSYLFPVLSQKGGPAEIAYLAQMNRIFSLFDLVAPYHAARATVSLVEKRFDNLMKQYDISFDQLAGDIEDVVNRVLRESFPSDLEQEFQKLRAGVASQSKRFMADSLKFDPSLDKFAEQIFGKVDYLLKQFEGKVYSSHKKKSQETRDRIYRLHFALYPNRGLQERSLNVACFIARYGMNVIDFLFEQMDSEQTSHQLIHLKEMDS